MRLFLWGQPVYKKTSMEIIGHMKRCSVCHAMKPLSEFGPDKRNKTHGRRPSCRDCFRNYGREYHRRTKHIHHYLKRIRKNYGISREVYFAALDRCGGLCECCGQPQSWKRLAVDHCHQTGTIRELL